MSELEGTAMTVAEGVAMCIPMLVYVMIRPQPQLLIWTPGSGIEEVIKGKPIFSFLY